MLPQVPPAQLQEWLASQAAQGEALVVVLDVREPWECALASVPAEGFSLRMIPMGELSSRLQELDPDQPVACLCHHGVRSMHVAAFLQRQGFDKVVNITGGIDAWSRERDPRVPRY